MDNNHKRIIRNVEIWPHRKGKTSLLRHLKGEPISRAEAVRAKCYECLGGEGGPCTATTCALYGWSQYSKTGHQTDSENDTEEAVSTPEGTIQKFSKRINGNQSVQIQNLSDGLSQH